MTTKPNDWLLIIAIGIVFYLLAHPLAWLGHVAWGLPYEPAYPFMMLFGLFVGLALITCQVMGIYTAIFRMFEEHGYIPLWALVVPIPLVFGAMGLGVIMFLRFIGGF